VSSILVFRGEALPTLRYFPKDTKLALGMTLLELNYILQVFCVRQEEGGGVNWNLPHPRVNKIKEHSKVHLCAVRDTHGRA